MINIKNICDVEAMAQIKWQEKIEKEFISWAQDWQYSLFVVMVLLFIV